MSHQIWRSRIKAALQNKKMDLYCQPIKKSPDGEVCAEEVLIRLVDTDKPIAAAAFIDAIALDADLMWELDRWVIQKAISAKLPYSHHINVSGSTCNRQDFADYVQQQIEQTNISPCNIYFELTEQSLICSYKQIEKLEALGCYFGIDDFLTGHNSFNMLAEMRPAFIKIPKQLTNVKRKVNAILISAILKICTELEIYAIAESIETIGAWQILEEINSPYKCNLYGQGYLFGQPQLCKKAQHLYFDY